MGRYSFLKTGDDVWAWAKKLVTDLNLNVGSSGGSGSVPAGSMMAWPVVTPPLGWLVCNGDSYTKADYGELFLAIGYTFGGAGSLFLLPDMRNRILMGAGTTVALGATAGALTKILTAANLPPHTHPVNDPGHTHIFTGDPHSHGRGSNLTGALAGASVGIGQAATAQATATGTNAVTNTGITVGNSTGTSDPLSILNPVFGVSVIIKH